MQYFIPTIQRSYKEAAQVALRNQQMDAMYILGIIRYFGHSLSWIKYSQANKLLSGVSIAKWPEGRKPISFIDDNIYRMSIIQSNKFGGHVLCETLDGKTPTIYVGTCEETYEALQDAMYTEMRYAQRTREKVINGKGAKSYSDHQRKIALNFVKASDVARNEWLRVLNKFVAACGVLEIGLPIGGYTPQDLIPRTLQYK